MGDLEYVIFLCIFLIIGRVEIFKNIFIGLLEFL